MYTISIPDTIENIVMNAKMYIINIKGNIQII